MLYSHWPAKANLIRKGKPEIMHLDDTQVYNEESALYTEFSKIVCISIGQVTFDDYDNPIFKVKSFYSDDEGEVVRGFFTAIKALFGRAPGLKLVGHNIKGFDMPYLIKRSLINGIQVPSAFHLHKQKPWENCLLDTQDVWKFGGWNSAKLGLISELLGIPSPKDAMSGPEVNEYYWNGRLEEIKTYCEKDIQATANIMLKMANMPIIAESLQSPF